MTNIFRAMEDANAPSPTPHSAGGGTTITAAPLYGAKISVTELDVLLGRGSSTRDHAGNVNAGRIVTLHKEEYAKATKLEKTRIAERIVQMIKVQGGRFLKFDDDRKEWLPVSDHVARNKISHLYRNTKYPKERKQEWTRQRALILAKKAEKEKAEKEKAKKEKAASKDVNKSAAGAPPPTLPSPYPATVPTLPSPFPPTPPTPVPPPTLPSPFPASLNQKKSPKAQRPGDIPNRAPAAGTAPKPAATKPAQGTQLAHQVLPLIGPTTATTTPSGSQAPTAQWKPATKPTAQWKPATKPTAQGKPATKPTQGMVATKPSQGKVATKPAPVKAAIGPALPKAATKPAPGKTATKPALLKAATKPSGKAAIRPALQKAVIGPAPAKPAKKPALLKVATKPAQGKRAMKPVEGMAAAKPGHQKAPTGLAEVLELTGRTTATTPSGSDSATFHIPTFRPPKNSPTSTDPPGFHAERRLRKTSTNTYCNDSDEGEEDHYMDSDDECHVVVKTVTICRLCQAKQASKSDAMEEDEQPLTKQGTASQVAVDKEEGQSSDAEQSMYI